MTHRTLPILAAAIASVTVFGIATVLERPAQAAEQLDPMQFARGAQTWADNCGRCHNMRNPKELRDDQWRAAMTHMRVRAGLTGEETRDILAFLQGSN